MRDLLTEQEKMYIKSSIFDPIEKDIPKISFFGTIDRGLRAMNDSVRQLKFDKKVYEAKFILEDMGERNRFKLRLLARRKDCDEIISLDTIVNSR